MISKKHTKFDQKRWHELKYQTRDEILVLLFFTPAMGSKISVNAVLIICLKIMLKLHSKPIQNAGGQLHIMHTIQQTSRTH